LPFALQALLCNDLDDFAEFAENLVECFLQRLDFYALFEVPDLGVVLEWLEGGMWEVGGERT